MDGSIIYTEIGSGKLIKAISRVVNLLNSMLMIHFSSINSISLLSDVWRLAVRRDEILFMLLQYCISYVTRLKRLFNLMLPRGSGRMVAAHNICQWNDRELPFEGIFK